VVPACKVGALASDPRAEVRADDALVRRSNHGPPLITEGRGGVPLEQPDNGAWCGALVG
jgi:hypothetical protein